MFGKRSEDGKITTSKIKDDQLVIDKNRRQVMIRVLMCEEHSKTSKILLKGTQVWTCMKNMHLDKSWMFTNHL